MHSAGNYLLSPGFETQSGSSWFWPDSLFHSLGPESTRKVRYGTAKRANETVFACLLACLLPVAGCCWLLLLPVPRVLGYLAAAASVGYLKGCRPSRKSGENETDDPSLPGQSDAQGGNKNTSAFLSPVASPPTTQPFSRLGLECDAVPSGGLLPQDSRLCNRLLEGNVISLVKAAEAVEAVEDAFSNASIKSSLLHRNPSSTKKAGRKWPSVVGR